MNIFSKEQIPVVACEVWFTADELFVRLSDGRQIGVPREWFPRLRDATPEQLARWRLIGGGIGITWDEIDEDISVTSLLQPESFPLQAVGTGTRA